MYIWHMLPDVAPTPTHPYTYAPLHLHTPTPTHPSSQHYLPNTIDDARFLTAEDKVQLKRQLHKEASMSDKSPPPTSLKGHPHQHPHHPHMADMGVLGMEGRVQAEEQVLLHTAGSGGTGKSKGSRENHSVCGWLCDGDCCVLGTCTSDMWLV